MFENAGEPKKYKGPKNFNATNFLKATIFYSLQYFYKNIGHVQCDNISISGVILMNSCDSNYYDNYLKLFG